MRYTIDGEPFDPEQAFMDEQISAVEYAGILDLEPGDTLTVGGGAFAEWEVEAHAGEPQEV